MGHGASTVVDAHAEDLERYLDFAALKGTKITHIIDTHIQADHRSGGRALAARTGAAYCLHESADVAFPFTPLGDGQELVCGNVVEPRAPHARPHAREPVSRRHRQDARARAVVRPDGGHALRGRRRSADLPGAAEASARALHRSLRRLLTLPDHTEIYPTHFSGSACGKGMSGKPMSTLAFEKRFNPVLAIASEDAFVAALTAELPPKPAGMAATLRDNQGRA